MLVLELPTTLLSYGDTAGSSFELISLTFSFESNVEDLHCMFFIEVILGMHIPVVQIMRAWNLERRHIFFVALPCFSGFWHDLAVHLKSRNLTG